MRPVLWKRARFVVAGESDDESKQPGAFAVMERNSHDPVFEPWVTEIRYLSRGRCLMVSFSTGETFEISAELLRVESPSAEVQGHSSGQKKIIAGRRFVGITAIEPVGNYAVKLIFDDLHDTGLYSWQYLYKLGRNQDKLWEDYLAALKSHGLTRELRDIVPHKKALH